MAWNTGIAGPVLDIAVYPSTPLRVMAGPGTGKTFAVMHRVARLLETGTSPSSILAVSFTRTAANDLISQLNSLGSPGAQNVTASTLHSLAFKLLRENAVFQATHRVARPLTSFESDCLVTDLAPNFGGKDAVKALVKAFGACWATLQHHQLGWPRDPIQQNFQRELLRWLTYHQAILIDELVPLALDYIRQNPASPHTPQYGHVLVDEYQDLNRADQEFVDAVARNGALTVIGDEDQSIYTMLRHAQPEGITQFHTSHSNTHDVPLHDCRRCPHQVVHMANALILHNHPQRPSTIRPMPGNSNGIVYIVQHNTVQQEIITSAAFVHWFLGNHPDVKPGQILVLSTRRIIGELIRDELVRLGHASQSFFAENYFEKPTAAEGYCLLTMLVRSDDRPALRAWLGIGSSNLRAPAYQRIWSDTDAAGVSPRQLLDGILSGSAQAPPYTDGLVQRYHALVTRLSALTGAMGTPLVDLLWPPGNPECADIRAVALSVAANSPSPEGMLEELTTAITQPELPSAQDDIIRVMSLHKSKGLTAKCVLVTGCIAGALPTIKAGLSTQEQIASLQEQRRLFYVAVTRTTDTLVLSGAALAPWGDAKRMGITVARSVGSDAVLQASQFMSEFGTHGPTPVSGNQWRSALGF
ncbi:MAG: ATP-dependent helicase [Dehalococcoidia bacterium]|nr:ATP-dependent helicase [Dehalococcoidia bacterium]